MRGGCQAVASVSADAMPPGRIAGRVIGCRASVGRGDRMRTGRQGQQSGGI